MTGSYLEQLGDDAARREPFARVVSEPWPQSASAREMLAQLLPGLDADRVFRALVAERTSFAEGVAGPQRPEGESALAARELERVRAQFALGAAAPLLLHAFSNPLTALLAEAALLELEPLADEHRAAVRRILALARRLVALSRRLGQGVTGSGAG